MFYVHKYFDRLSRDSEGISVIESDDGKTRVVASRKRDGSLELIVWELRYGRSLENALETLKDEGLAAADLKSYGSIDQLENSILAGKAIEKKHASAFRKASEVYRNTRLGGNSLALRFEGAKGVRVTASEAVGVRAVGRQAFTSGSDLLVNLPRSEVMWMRVELD